MLGTGLRWFVEQLATPDQVAALRAACLRHARDVRTIETNVIYAVARV